MSESKIITIQLSDEDGDRLFSEAKRRQIDASTLAQMLLHDSLTKLNPPPSPLSQADIESLEKLYKFRKKTEVLEFLEKYPFLFSLLLEAHPHICKYFPDSPLFLQYVPDPEIDYPLLVVYIVTDIHPNKADNLLDKLDEWWVEVEYRAQGKMLINLDWLD